MSELIIYYCDGKLIKKVWLSGLNGILILLCIYMFVKQTRFTCNLPTKIIKSIYIPYTLSFICWILFSIVNFIASVFVLTSKCYKNKFITIKDGFIVSIYNFGLSNIYLLYLYRLKYSFSNTDFNISTTKFKILFSLYMVQIIFGIMQIIFGLILIKTDKIYTIDDPFHRMYDCVQGLIVIIYHISSIILVTLYLRKTIGLTKNKSPVDTKSIAKLRVYTQY